ncbi:MAG: CocE/NonD family hydrolase [Proteobacteria bacterium]|nr:CocE/NonD family hydrolase [Pseudomonadota bacterium]
MVQEFPCRIREIETLWIPAADGTQLAARVWLPEDAEKNPVPAILEYIPYRRRDSTRARDAAMHPYIAGHGYACIRLDIRGSGDSEGVLTDEYLASELEDGVAAIAWIAKQPWCTGAVGIIGNSWGGFNGLQIAALRPPALKAIITSCSTDDRYADDVHFMGGQLINDNLSWASTMLAHNARPPDPAVVGERWRGMWMERLEGSGLWVANWLKHQRRDAFWKHGSVCEDYGAIQCPVYAVGGWMDSYKNAIPRLMAGLAVPRKAMIGQWAHRYPHMAAPGPAVGFLKEALRWWDKWLKGQETGIMDEPMLRLFMQESVPPATFYESLPGRWVAEPAWPSPTISPVRYALNPGRIEAKPAPEQALAIRSPHTVGLSLTEWCLHGQHHDAPDDQRLDDGGSLVFDTEPLPQKLEILGAPAVELELAFDRPQAMLAVRLSDVAPGGAATLVAYGLLNLSHRDSHAAPSPLVPGKRVRVRVQLNDCGRAFPKGNRLRIAVSTSYWPIAWPAPENATLTLYAGASALVLPVRPPAAADANLKPLPPVELPPPEPTTTIAPDWVEQTVSRDRASGITTCVRRHDRGLVKLDAIDLTLGGRTDESFAIHPDDPLSARAEILWTVELSRGDWRVRTETRTRMHASRSHFHIEASLDAFEGTARVFSRSWQEAIPRDHT